MEGQASRFLLIVRERVRLGHEAAYDDNERQIAAACAALKCPHAYLALTTVTEPTDVWWLNAFASLEERHSVEASYTDNGPLMAAIAPLAARKHTFRESIASTMTESRSDLSASALRIAGSRFFVVTTVAESQAAMGTVFQAPDGSRFTFAVAHKADAADDLGARMGTSARILRVRPEWSFPDQDWIAADPGFWKP